MSQRLLILDDSKWSKSFDDRPHRKGRIFSRDNVMWQTTLRATFCSNRPHLCNACDASY